MGDASCLTANDVGLVRCWSVYGTIEAINQQFSGTKNDDSSMTLCCADLNYDRHEHEDDMGFYGSGSRSMRPTWPHKDRERAFVVVKYAVGCM